MSELLKKYESIDQSKLNEGAIKILNRVKTITTDFTTDDVKNNKIANDVLDEIMKKFPDSVKIVKRTPKAKPAPKKTHKASHTKKSAHTTTSTTKKSGNNIMSVAKEIQKAGESWKDAMERAKQVLKERKEQVVQKQKTELEKLFALVKTKKELQGFAKSDIQRDAVRDAKPRGARVVTKQGSTSNQYGTFSNKLGRKYWETRDRHADRLAPNYPKDMPLLASGGSVNMDKHIWEGWTVGDFIEELEPTFNQIMRGSSWQKPFKTKDEVKAWAMDNQPYYKKNIPEVVNYFWAKAQSKDNYANGGELEKYKNQGWKKTNRSTQGFDVFSKKIDESTHYAVFDKKGNFLSRSKNNPEQAEMEAYQVVTKKGFVNGGSVKKVPAYAKKRLEELREEIRAERISYGELAELQSLAQYIEPNDVELLEPAGVPEFDEDQDDYAKGGEFALYKIQQKFKYALQPKWEDEKFQTGGRKFLTFAQAQDFKKKLQGLSSSMEYKVVKVGEDEKLADGGSLPFMTDPNFGNFQNTGAFAHGGSVKKVPAYVKRRLEELREEIIKERISTGEIAELQSLAQYIDPSDVELLEWAGVPEFEEEEEEYTDFSQYDTIAYNLTEEDAVKLANEQSEKDPNSQIVLAFTGKGFNVYVKKSSFANGGELKDFEQTVKDALKVNNKWHFISQNVDGKSVQLKMYVGSKEVDVQIFKIDGVYASMPKNYAGKRETLKMIMNNFNENYELGGAFMMTDLAGHTGGSDGLGNQMPLSGTSGTHYTGLVGETGAMSSGELFENGGGFGNKYYVGKFQTVTDWDSIVKPNGVRVYKDVDGYPLLRNGKVIKVYKTKKQALERAETYNKRNESYEAGGAMMANQQVIDGASQNYVITESFGNPAQQLGMLAKGGAIKNQYEGRTPEDVWNNLTIEQRAHFLHDHNNLITYYISTDPKVKSGTLISDIYSAYKSKSLNYSKLNKYVKQVFEEHIKTGQYASGGSLGKALYVEYSSYFDYNKYDTDKIISALKGIGAKNIRLENDRGWSNQPEVVVFNGSKNQAVDALNEAFDTDYIRVSEKDWRTKKMADGGDVLPPSKTYGENIYKAMQKFNISDSEARKKYGQYTISQWNELLSDKMADGGAVNGTQFMSGVYAKGGFVGTVEFNAGDVVWQKDEKRYATVMNNYGDAINGDGGEIRLDTTGNTNIFTYDKKTYENTGYNLVKLGEKGDTGKFTPEVVAEMKESANRLIDSRKERDDTEMIEYYEGIYKRLLDGEFDSMTGAKSTASNKKGSRDYTYVPNKDVKELSVVVKGELKKLMGSDILDGVYVKNSAKSAPKVDANAVFAKILKDAKEAKSGKTKRFDASDLKKINLEMVKKLVDAGYTEQQVRNIIFGYAFDNEIVADNELEYDNGVFSYEESYVKQKIDDLVEAQKNKEFVAGIEYPNFDWQNIIKKYKITSKPKQIVIKRNFGSGSYNEYYYEVFVGENIALAHNFGYKDFGADGKLKGDYTEKGKKVSDPTKQNAWQKERGQKAGFNGGYWYIVSSKIETIDDILKTLLSQKDGYCKELELYSDSFPKTLKDNKISFADGGEMEVNNIDAELEDFDLDNLDPFETMQYNNFSKSSGKVGALQILINSVEGDYSQLSPELAELAEMQISQEQWDESSREMYGYAKGGMMAKGGMVVYLDGEKSKSFKTKKSLYEFVRSQAGTGVKKVEIDYGNRIIPTFDTYVIEDGKLIHKGELIQKNYDKEEAEKRRLETQRSINQMMGYADGGELKGKFLAEIKVPYNFEDVVEDEYEFSRFLSKALTNKFNFGNGAWSVKIVKPLFERDYSKRIVVEIEIPVGVTQGGGLDKFDVLEFMSKTLTKKWFGNGIWGVDIVSSYADGGFMNNVYADGGFLNENQIEKLDEGFTIPQLNDMLDEMFPYSFGFEVYKQEQSSSRNEGKFSYDYDNKVKDDKLKLYFYFEGYGRDLNYQVSQGQENTYFKFLLVDDKINTYVGGFGFKDKGDVDESYITKFISFLQDAYHYSFKVRHSVMADGGMMADGGFMNDVYANGGNLDIIDLYDDFYVKGYENKAYQFAYVPDFSGKESVIAYTMGLEDGGKRNKKDYESFEKAMQKDSFADGGMFDDNDGFMKADNNRNFRYPEKEVYIETLDEPIDLTSTVTIKSNEVVISPIDENIDLNDDNRIRARMTQSNIGSAENFGKINPRAFEFIDLPMPTSNKHKND